ncbi:MAG: two-component regulator propeller domain-containing protein [Planctomycetota bacterium]
MIVAHWFGMNRAVSLFVCSTDTISCHILAKRMLTHLTVSAICLATLIAQADLPPADDASHQDDPSADFEKAAPLAINLEEDAKLGGVIRSLFQDSEGVLWIGGEGDLFRNDGKTVTSFQIRGSLGQSVTIKQIVEDRDGKIWCGTTAGITRIDGETFTSFGESEGLACCDVWSMEAGKDGSLWIGTLEGVWRYDGVAFTQFAIPKAKPDLTRGVTSARIVHCILEDRRGNVWFGTNGGAYIYNGKSLTNLSVKDGLPNDVVHNLLEDSKGHIWIGTTHNGISRFDGEGFTNFTADGVIEGNEIWCIAEDRAGDIWFSGKHLGVYKYDGDSFQQFGTTEGLSSPGLMDILEDTGGRLWLGGVNGLFRFNGTDFENVSKNGPWR